METRFLLHRMTTPFAGVAPRGHAASRSPPVAERRRRGRCSGGCRLTTLEETLCGHVREGDVPGFEIPSRTSTTSEPATRGRSRPLSSTTGSTCSRSRCITGHASQLLDEGPAAARTAREASGLGRLYERAGMIAEACACYLRADELPGDVPSTGAEALRAYAVLSRRAAAYEDAAAAWRRVLGLRRCPPAHRPRGDEALAVHHEHRARDLTAARALGPRVAAIQQQRVAAAGACSIALPASTASSANRSRRRCFR